MTAAAHGVRTHVFDPESGLTLCGRVVDVRRLVRDDKPTCRKCAQLRLVNRQPAGVANA